ncbi:hypothetical protein J7M07_07160 [bacterium]|nr:hypothetical protein [bacterium]
MSVKKMSMIMMLSIATCGAILMGCDSESTYQQRTVVYVSNINEGAPYMSDVLNQGDSLYYTDSFVYKTVDDYVVEDIVTVNFTNRPYSGIVDVDDGSLGDFLITGYKVEYESSSGTTPVQIFSGKTSIFVPANSTVEGSILLVPFIDKNRDPLQAVRYSSTEILSNAIITFNGHEIQAENRTLSFSAGLQVGFADVLNND